MNLMMLLEMAVSGVGDRVAVRSGAEELTYQQLFDAAGAAATAHLGLQRGPQGVHGGLTRQPGDLGDKTTDPLRDLAL